MITFDKTKERCLWNGVETTEEFCMGEFGFDGDHLEETKDFLYIDCAINGETFYIKNYAKLSFGKILGLILPRLIPTDQQDYGYEDAIAEHHEFLDKEGDQYARVSKEDIDRLSNIQVKPYSELKITKNQITQFKQFQKELDELYKNK